MTEQPDRADLDRQMLACMERVGAPAPAPVQPRKGEGMESQMNDETMHDVDDAIDEVLSEEDEDAAEAETEAEAEAEAVDDTPEETITGAAPAAQVEVVRGEREFHISGTVVKENESTAGLTNEQARDVLKLAFPEVANATIRASVKNGVSVVEFLPQPGRKG